MKKTIKIAGIQMHANKGQFKQNQDQAVKWIKEAVSRGAEMVILPELFSCGYIPNKEIWAYAEKDDDITLTFLKNVARQFGIYLGAGLLEIIHGEYRNTYVMAGPGGDIIGRAEKNNGEAYVFKRGNGLHVIETSFGKIGVGICADNHYTEFVKDISKEDIKLLIMPHASSLPFRESKTVKKEDIGRAKKDMQGFPSLIAKLINVPTVFVNQIGELYEMVGIFGKIMNPTCFSLGGNSRIALPNGRVLSSLENEEGIIIADVDLSYKTIRNDHVPNHQGWVQEGPKLLRRVILPLDIMIGKVYYHIKKPQDGTILSKH